MTNWESRSVGTLALAGQCQGYAVGSYIPDFSSPKAKLVIELDGSQHLEQDASQYDEERIIFLESQGYKVIRFWNNQVMNDIEGVIRAIMFAMGTDTHSQQES